jgi:hypothetical protein
MGQVFAEEHKIAGLERPDVVAHEPCACACGEQSEFHGGMEMPMVAFARERLGFCGGKQTVDMGNVFGPAEEPEGVACWEMDLLTFASHGVTLALCAHP